uniref:Uncharacterized protein n=1 Tax=Aegilops tauschii subsp. strangulata TaxID=200361 RepID=A0A453T4M5_AEGTS
MQKFQRSPLKSFRMPGKTVFYNNARFQYQIQYLASNNLFGTEFWHGYRTEHNLSEPTLHFHGMLQHSISLYAFIDCWWVHSFWNSYW